MPKIVPKIIYKMYGYFSNYFEIRNLKKLEILKNIILIFTKMDDSLELNIDGYSVENLRKIFVED